MSIAEVTTRTIDGVEVSKVERTLYTLAELKDGKHIEGEDVVEHKRAGAYNEALSKIQQMKDESSWTQDDLETEISEYINPEIIAKAGLITEAKDIGWDVSYVQGGRYVTLDDRKTSVDVPVFLRAMKGWFMGKDWRGHEYARAEQKPRFPTEGQQHKIDLRSADARQAMGGSLVVQTVSKWTGEIEPEPYDYGFEFSQQFMQDCNDFLAEVLSFAFRTLEATYEDAHSEETILADAEANEWTFTNTGAWA